MLNPTDAITNFHYEHRMLSRAAKDLVQGHLRCLPVGRGL